MNAISSILSRCLERHDLSQSDAVVLLGTTGNELRDLVTVADQVRRDQAGDRVAYVINRNINFTNVCIKTCRFCAFARGVRSEEGYFLPLEEVVRRAIEAHELGATEVCIQAGLAPNLKGEFYLEVCRAVKRAIPSIHIHAFSPEEIKYGAALSRLSIREFLIALKEAGLDSIPGTSAEILIDEVRDELAPNRITTEEWFTVVRTAHELGMRSTATIMFGHLESPAHIAAHLESLRRLQLETGGFTEFVPLSFIHTEAPLYQQGKLDGVRPGATREEVLRMYAVSRLMLGKSFLNVQASWVKQGISFATETLNAGANDLGGTLMNESISTSAGAAHGQLMTPSELRAAIRSIGRSPAQRSTLYVVLDDFSAGEPAHALDLRDRTFGSYRELIQNQAVRYRGKKLPLLDSEDSPPVNRDRTQARPAE